MNIIMLYNNGKNQSVHGNGRRNGNIVFVSNKITEVAESDLDDPIKICRIRISGEPDEETGNYTSLEIRPAPMANIQDCMNSDSAFYYNIVTDPDKEPFKMDKEIE